jgi:hypothetical protein
MKNDLIKQSEKWREKAEKILHQSGLERILRKFGEVIYSGSYSADLMMHGDIDIYVLNTFFTKEQVLRIFQQIANASIFEGYLFYDWRNNKHLNFPSGYYVGLKNRAGDGDRWKIDIWFITKREYGKIKYRDLDRIEITKEQRLTILRLKEYRNRSSQNISSTIIYDAVLKRRVGSLKKFKQYIAGKI